MNKPELIIALHPVPCYTPAEAEQAKKDMECSADFDAVGRELNGDLYLWQRNLTLVRIDSDLYPSLKPGAKERIDVIAGCGE